MSLKKPEEMLKKRNDLVHVLADKNPTIIYFLQKIQFDHVFPRTIGTLVPERTMRIAKRYCVLVCGRNCGP